MTMGEARWLHQNDVEPAFFPDRYSIDLVGGPDIPTTAGFNVGVAFYTAEEFGEPQVHADQEAIYVVSGAGELRVGGEVVPLRPGVAVYVPPGTPHGGRTTGPDPVHVVYAHGAL